MITYFMGKFYSVMDFFQGYMQEMNSFLVPNHNIMNMSSMYIFQVWMWFCPNSIRLVSSLPMNRFVQAGAIFVPIAVPWICKQNFSLNSKTLLVRTICISSANTCGVGCSGCRYASGSWVKNAVHFLCLQYGVCLCIAMIRLQMLIGSYQVVWCFLSGE